jgi:hypothetical protein
MKDVEIEDDAFTLKPSLHLMTSIERTKPSVIDVKEKLELQKVLEQNRASESTDETV